jgi:hypothetical protein
MVLSLPPKSLGNGLGASEMMGKKSPSVRGGVHGDPPMNLRDDDFPELMASIAEKSQGRVMDAGASSSSGNQSRIQESDFISKGMYQIAMREDQERKLKQAEEIKKLLFGSSQNSPVLKHIFSKTVIGESHSEEAVDDDLELALKELDDAMNRMNLIDARVQGGTPSPGEHNELNRVPESHAVIFNHSRRAQRPKFVWISKTSTVDKEGNLGFLASWEEIRKYGAGARKVFLRHPPSELKRSYV